MSASSGSSSRFRLLACDRRARRLYDADYLVESGAAMVPEFPAVALDEPETVPTEPAPPPVAANGPKASRPRRERDALSNG